MPDGTNHPKPNYMRAAWDAGFRTILPVIPVGAQLRGEVVLPDGDRIPALDPATVSFGKEPGKVGRGGLWSRLNGWREFTCTENEVALYDHHCASSGLRLGDPWAGVDVDILDKATADAIWGRLVTRFPDAYFRIGQAPKFMMPIRITGDETLTKHKIRVGDAGFVELLASGQQVVLFGTHPVTQQPYSWYHGSGMPMPPHADALPSMTASEAVALVEEVCRDLGHEVTRVGGGSGVTSGMQDSPAIEVAAEILHHLPNHDADWDTWKHVLMILKTCYGDEAWPMFAGWSARSAKHNPKTDEAQWVGYHPNGSLTWGSMQQLLGDLGVVLPADLEGRRKADLSGRRAEAAVAKMPPSDMVVPPPGAQPVTGQVMLSKDEILQLDAKEVETARLAAAYKVAGDPLYDIFLLAASDHRFKTEFEKRVKRFESEYRLKQLEEQTTERELILLRDPNEYMGQAIRLEEVIGAKDLAFSFLENAVIIKRMRSAVGRVVRRDKHGNRIIGADGEPEADEAWTYRGKIMRKPEFVTVASSAAYFADKDGNGAMIPAQFLSHLEAVAGESLKPVASIAQHPVMWRGKLLFGDGEYHAGSGLYLATGHLEPYLWADPAAAYRFLRHDWLGDFPFQTERDALVAIAAAATLLVVKTDLLDEAGPPITLFTAPSPSIGKSYLQTIIHVGVTGAPLPTMMYPTKPEEREKLFMAAILQGYSHLAFDNLTNGSTLGNSHRELLQLTTSPSMAGRILGESTTGSGYTGLMVTMNGNGIITTGDMVSRLLECRLVPPVSMTNLVQRAFRHSNLTEWTRENRGKIVGALASILSVQTNERKGTRFGAWSRSVASPLMEVSGVTDLFDEWIEAGEADAQGFASGQVHDLMLAMAAVCRDAEGYSTWCTASEIVAHLTITAPQLLVAIFGTVNPKPDEVSRYLKKHRDVRHDGRILRGSSENLQDRTNYKKRMVFRIE